MNREGDVKVDSTPKNIRQIGAGEERIKVYMEDYVSTYLRKLQEEREDTEEGGAMGLLVGHWERNGEVPHGFINGAMELDLPKQENGSWDFSKEVWTKAYDLLQQYFPGQDLCGIFACEGIYRRFSKQMLFRLTKENFADCQESLLYVLTDEGEEFFYRILDKGQERLNGYYCYFERNEAMQDYMMDHLRPRSVENEPIPIRKKAEDSVKDPVESYRQSMKKEAENLAANRSNGRGLYALCASMACIVFLGGALLMKQRREGVQVSDLLERLHIGQEDAVAVNGTVEQNSIEEEGAYEKIVSNGNGIIVEEIPGNVETTGNSENSGGQVVENPEKDGQTSETEERDGETQTEEGGENSGEIQAEEGGENSGETQAEERGESSGDTQTEESTEAAPVLATPGMTYVVQAGDSLSAISRRFYGTDAFVRTIQELNQLSDADLIQAGQVLILP
jgi:LysM repeat protein